MRLLAEGGMGRVFEAEHLFTAQRVAIKVLHGDLLSDPTQRHRFLREARACVRIAHPNIVQVFDLDMDDSGMMPFIVQELLHGETLAAALVHMPGRRLEPRAALQALVPVMGALVGAHRRGVVHRDVKPENIFLSDTPAGVVPKLLDFGVARVRVEGHETALTATGLLIGTPEYMSPEQAAGDATVDAQTDVWAMGAVLYEALAGRPVFWGESVPLVLVQVLHGAITPLREVNPDVPADVAAAVHRALERDRAQRYPTMRRMVEALLETSAWSSEAGPPEFDTTLRDIDVQPADPADLGDTADAVTLERAPLPRPELRVDAAPATPRRSSPRTGGRFGQWAFVVALVVGVVVVAFLTGRALGQR